MSQLCQLSSKPLLLSISRIELCCMPLHFQVAEVQGSICIAANSSRPPAHAVRAARHTDAARAGCGRGISSK